MGFFYPAVCQVCGHERVSAGAGYVCARCCERPDGVRRIREPFCERCGLPFAGEMQGPFRCAHCGELELDFCFARAAVVATALVLDVIHRYKYGRSVWFEPFLADLLAQAAGPELAQGGWDCLVPVPLFPVREREREFNQSARLAARLGAATGLPVRRGVVQRRRPTQTQTQLSREERAANMRGAFAPAGARRLQGERVVLVDDVLTTGATTSACARALKAAGASEVCVWTVARGTWQT
jgi:ComF family protein